MNNLVRRLAVALALAAVSTLLAVAPASAAPPRVVFAAPNHPTGPANLVIANLDGSGRVIIAAGEGSRPDVSPDGTRVVYVGSSGIVRANLDGSHRMQVVEGPNGLVGQPAWSPDGATIAYVQFRGGPEPQPPLLHLVGVAGTNDRVVASGVVMPSWSPDGRRLAMLTRVTQDGVDRSVIQTMTRDGRDVRTVYSVDWKSIRDLAWSPDGRHIAIVEAPWNGAGPADIRIVPLGGGTVRVVPNTSLDGESVGWTDDGSRLVFDGMLPDSFTTTSFTIRLDGSDRRALLAGASAVQPVFVGSAPGSVPAGAGFDGEPSTTERLDAGSPTEAAIAASRRLWSDKNGVVAAEASESALPRATYAVLSRIDTFADSLAGAALTFRGPLLYTTTAQLPAETRAELGRILGPRGLVYVLGGDKAISPAVVATLQADGFTVRRLAGASRVETAIAVADEVRAQFPNYRRVLLARADGPGTAAWADSVTGGAFAADARIPLLLTPTDQLHPAVKAWMDRTSPSQTLLLGGPSALTARVEQAVPSPLRLAGAARDETATTVARTLWKVEPPGTRRYTVINGYATDGWAWGLAAAGLADRADAPLLMIHPDTVPSATVTAVTGCRQIDLLVVGNTTSVNQARINDLNTHDTRC